MLRRCVAAAGLGAALLAMAGAPSALAAGTLHWDSPKTITSGVPFHVASIDPCPPVPTAGDTTLVQIFLTFSGGGGSGDPTFTFSGVGRQAQLSASCLDYNGVSATPYATYAVHHVKLVF